MVMHYLYVLLSCSRVSLVLYFALFNMFLFCFSKKKKKIRKIQKQCVFVYIGTCVPWMAIETKLCKLCIFCSLDKHLNAQLSK